MHYSFENGDIFKIYESEMTWCVVGSFTQILRHALVHCSNVETDLLSFAILGCTQKNNKKNSYYCCYFH